MVIDFHVHFFPDNIAKRSIQALSDAGGVQAHGDGTLQDLIRYMKEDGVDYAVNQPVATKAEQVMGINRRMIQSNQEFREVISFGAMHPDFGQIGDIREELDFLSSNGVQGIKLHPEYQDFYPNDDKMAPIYEACRDKGLLILFHAGRDLAFQDVHGTPARFQQVAKIRGLKMVLGHLGGYHMWDEVEKEIMGLDNVYLDTAFCDEMEEVQMKELIFGHSPDRILFASDFPWQRQSDLLKKLKTLDLGASSESMILGGNAKELLQPSLKSRLATSEKGTV